MQLRGILMAIFISYILMASLLPFVRALRRANFPRILAVLIPYVSMILLMVLLIFPLIPFFISQVQSLLNNFPTYLKESANTFGFTLEADEIRSWITREINGVGRNAVAVTSKVFGGVFSILTIFIISFYLLLYQDHFKKAIAALFHKDAHEEVMETMTQIDEKLGAWLRGQVLLSVAIGVMTWIMLTVLGLQEFALPLAVLAGLLEVIPTLGPTLSAIPAVVVALTISPTLAIAVVVTYAAIQAIENNFLVPKIMQRAVGLNPVVVIIAVMIGANLMGVFGALLSIPFVSFIMVLFNSINRKDEV